MSKQTWHRLIGGGAMGLVVYAVGFDVLQWQSWFLLLSVNIWYATKPNE